MHHEKEMVTMTRLDLIRRHRNPEKLKWKILDLLAAGRTPKEIAGETRTSAKYASRIARLANLPKFRTGPQPKKKTTEKNRL